FHVGFYLLLKPFLLTRIVNGGLHPPLQSHLVGSLMVLPIQQTFASLKRKSHLISDHSVILLNDFENSLEYVFVLKILALVKTTHRSDHPNHFYLLAPQLLAGLWLTSLAACTRP